MKQRPLGAGSAGDERGPSATNFVNPELKPHELVPLGFEHELQRRDLIQRHDIVRLVWKLVCCLVGDKDSLDWVEINEAWILC